MIPTACDNGLEIEESVSGPLHLSGALGKVACFKIQKPPSSK